MYWYQQTGIAGSLSPPAENHYLCNYFTKINCDQLLIVCLYWQELESEIDHFATSRYRPKWRL